MAWRLVVILALLTSCGAHERVAQPHGGPSGTACRCGRILGIVTADDGRHLGGVTVLVRWVREPRARRAITDANGFYTIDDLAPGDYEATMSYGGRTIERGRVHVRADQVTPMYAHLFLGLRRGRVPRCGEVARAGGSPSPAACFP